MGTYTTNKELYKPSVGETGWGTLVNENFETIDTFLKPISLSGSTYTFTGNQTGGSVSATSITNSGTLTSTGKITANGGIAGTTGTFSGVVTAATFNGVSIKSSGTYTVASTNTIGSYVLPIGITYTMLLPPWNGLYTGSIKFSPVGSNGSSNYPAITYFDGTSTDSKKISCSNNTSDISLSFTNIPYLLVGRSTSGNASSIGTTFVMRYYRFTLT